MPFCPAYDAAGGNEFGWRVAVEGDPVVVASWHDDDDGTDCGSAYVFTEPNTGRPEAMERTRLTASDAAGGDQFGASVVVGGHGGDGRPRGRCQRRGFRLGVGVSGLRLDRRTHLDGVPDSAAGETNATSYTLTVLTNDVGYSFRIRATNGGGTSPVSDAVTVTPAS